MRRYLSMILILFVAVSCGSIPIRLIQSAPTQTTTTLPLVTPTIPPSRPPTKSPSPTSSPLAPKFTLSPSPFAPTITPASSQTQTLAIPFMVIYHPDDMLYVGDLVSFEVVSSPGLDLKDANVKVQVDPPVGPELGQVNFSSWGIEGREEATMLWSWDTKNLEPGLHTLSFDVQPQGYTWTEQVTLLPSSSMPAAQAAAHWTSTQTNCCTVFYVTNTASERDLPSLTTLIDEQAQDAMEKMSASFTQPITITVLPRLLGHGGFTSTEISVSYLDRNYASNSWALVVHHEMIHAIDGHLGGDFRPTIFVEGLAVYMTGGHYKTEPLMPRAAALLPIYLDRYIPLKGLADDFYAAQHEIGYLEGASLIEYMVNTYSQAAFLAFYRDIHTHEGESQSEAIDAALQAHFSISFSQLEQDFLAALNNEPDTATWVDDVRLTVSYYDTMRRYQQLLDPSAYFRTAWLLDNKTMRERGIVADYLRHPHTPVNLALETLLITAHQQMVTQDYTSAIQSLDVINAVLDGIERSTTDPFSISLLAADYLSISATLQQQGYEVQSISINGNSALTNVTTSASQDLLPLTLQRTGGKWYITP